MGTELFVASDPKRFERAIQRIDEENSQDPNVEMNGERPVPRELLYAQRLTERVLALRPDASEELRLAARAQHVCRWSVPRESYAMTRPGYLKWRQDLKQLHARKAAEILQETGYPAEMIERVRQLVLKANLATDPETQTLEDALCLVFLEHQLAALALKNSEEKVISALQKSWGKMSEAGRKAALALPLGQKEKRLLDRALAKGAEALL